MKLRSVSDGKHCLLFMRKKKQTAMNDNKDTHVYMTQRKPADANSNFFLVMQSFTKFVSTLQKGKHVFKRNTYCVFEVKVIDEMEKRSLHALVWTI